jgi:hypothetical protein
MVSKRLIPVLVAFTNILRLYITRKKIAYQKCDHGNAQWNLADVDVMADFSKGAFLRTTKFLNLYVQKKKIADQQNGHVTWTSRNQFPSVRTVVLILL